MITGPRAVIGGMCLACVIATLVLFYYASLQKVRPYSTAKNEGVHSRALPAKGVAP